MTARVHAEPALSIDLVNALSTEAFVDRFGAVLEESPHLAESVASMRPFADAAALADAFVDVVRSLDPDAALSLIRAHPELGARRPMAAASVDEQASAGLPGADAEVRARLAEANAAYRARHGFPFVLAVRGRTPDEVLAELSARSGNDRDDELATALEQVCTIARSRIEQHVASP